MSEPRILIVGGGVTGIALARALALRGEHGITVLEKEGEVAFHTSGRNSGVLHAGYVPRPGTLKATLCVEGNRRILALCRERGVSVVEGGILIVARHAGEVPRLEEFHRRGLANGVPRLRMLESREIASVEPNAVGEAALHAPTGSSVDSKAYVRALAKEAVSRGVEIRFGARVHRVSRVRGGFEVRLTSGERLQSPRLANCAGLHADRIAHALGAGEAYGIVPIRGEYRKLVPEKSGMVRSMVYPVPDPDLPFLGVHWTKKVTGDVMIGPNAVPAFGREAYGWSIATLRGMAATAADPRAWMLLQRPGFAELACSQIHGSLSLRRFASDAAELVPGAGPEDFVPGPAGIRAQVVDRQGRMVEDLLVEEKDGALHVLNVVSPGLTCSLPFAEALADRLVA